MISGDGSGATTTSVTNQSTTGGLLKITGNMTAGTGAGTAGGTTLSFGSTGTHNGNYEVTGNITKGTTATGISITKRGTGILALSGNNAVTSMGQSEAGSTIVIAGGKTEILQGNVNTNWGGNAVSTLVKITGGELYANYATLLRSKLEIDGGKLTIGSTATESILSFDNAAVSGEVFTLGNAATTGATTSYALSGGTLDLKGQTGTQGYLQINADAAGLSTTTFTLSGTGKKGYFGSGSLNAVIIPEPGTALLGSLGLLALLRRRRA